MHGQSLKCELFTSEERKKGSYKHTSGIEWFLSVIEKLHSTINILKHLIY